MRWLRNAHIPEYEFGTFNNHTARRNRKLLLHPGQIDKLDRQVADSGRTLVPLSIYSDATPRSNWRWPPAAEWTSGRPSPSGTPAATWSASWPSAEAALTAPLQRRPRAW